MPLIDWRRLDAQRDSARTELELAALQLRDTVARGVVEVEALLVEGQRLRDQQAANARGCVRSHASRCLLHCATRPAPSRRADWLQLEVARLDAEISAQRLLLRERVQREQLARRLPIDDAAAAPA